MGAHVELIDSTERLAPGFLGGTGYLVPNRPATRAELLVDLDRTDGGRADLGFTTWKVKRKSVDWNHSAPINERRIHIGNNRIACSILGGDRHWWFVAVQIKPAVRLLRRAEQAEKRRLAL